MPENKIDNIFEKLSAIEIERSLDKKLFLQVLSASFQTSGKNLIYITNDTSKAWLYFDKNHLVSAYTNNEQGKEAINEIIAWDDFKISEYRNVDIPETHFSYNQSTLFSLFDTPEIENEHFKLHFSKLKKLNFISGLICLNKLIIRDNSHFTCVDFPIEYFFSYHELIDHGEYVYIGNLKEKNISYLIYKKNKDLWVFSINNDTRKHYMINDQLDQITGILNAS